jgi:hypothetical protein
MFFSDGDNQKTHKHRWSDYILKKLPHLKKIFPSYGTDGTRIEEESDGFIPSGTNSPGGSSNQSVGSKSKKLGLAALIVLIYYEVSGGPFGIEDIVRAGGPLYAILGFSLFLVWVIPEALVTAELSTALPEASGAVGKCCRVVLLFLLLLLYCSCTSF